MNLYLCGEHVRRSDIEMFIHPGFETLASYIAIAKWKTSGHIRRVTEELEKDSDRFRLTSETVEHLAPFQCKGDSIKLARKVELFAQKYL